MTSYRTLLCLLLLAAGMLAAGCATSPPPPQLLDARKAYDEARNGDAARVAPAELHVAKVKLNDAEQSYVDEPDSARTYALSYVALRETQRVQVLASTKIAKSELDTAVEEAARLKEAEMARTRGELARTRQELQSKGAQLEQERAARLAAEAREREAMKKLAEAAALSVKEESRGTVIILPGSVLFATGKYELTPGAQEKLAMIASTLAPQAENHDIVVEGHTDAEGRRDANMVLGQDRARVVMDFLIARGVPREAISSVGIGPDRPMADNETREGRQQNRRVEIIVKPMK
jgi:outer membrane protein OmpA-like peptidoglycan-associated protein